MTLPSRQFVIGEVDREFRIQHPEAPTRLDQHDPAQAHFVQQWNAMYHEFLSRTVDSHFYRFYPNAGRPLNPNDPGDAQLVEFWKDIRDAVEGRPHRFDWSSEPHVAGDQPAGQGQDQATGAASPTHPDTSQVHMDESAFRELIHSWLEGAHYVGDTAEVLGYLAQGFGAGEESALVVFGEALGPIGTIASGVIVLWTTVHAFGTGRRLQEQEGFCYGVMWQTAGLGNAEKHFIDWFDDSADELRESFYDGVAAGREKASETVVHNKIMLVTAYYQACGDDLETARHRVLNDLWLHVRESEYGRDYLTWPTPIGMQE